MFALLVKVAVALGHEVGKSFAALRSVATRLKSGPRLNPQPRSPANSSTGGRNRWRAKTLVGCLGLDALEERSVRRDSSCKFRYPPVQRLSAT